MADEFLAIAPDGKRYELIDGEFIVHATPPVRHQSVLVNILSPLSMYCRDHDAETFLGPLDVHLSDDSVVEPDGFVVCRERMSIVGDDYIHGVPNIIIEILSDETRRRDEVDKRDLYERVGVDEYWIVDPDHDIVTIYRRRGASFAPVETGGTITSPLLPRFALDINVIFDV